MPKSRKNPGRGKRIKAIRHTKDKRSNIPTRAYKSVALNSLGFHNLSRWPRDFAKDPQLVWGGKFASQAEEDMDLIVPEVGLQILEKISPQAIIENLKTYVRGAVQEQSNLFGRNFNGLPEEFSERLRFYEHKGDWQNRMILGDSLQVMNSLLKREEMAGKVQMCYIDPPYGIDFRSNWQASSRSHEVDNKVKSVSQELEVVRAFRDTWEYGIHSYLAYLSERLFLARELLTQSGSCFVQISEKNVHYVRCLLDEIFGVENFVDQITYRVSGGTREKQGLRRNSDYILWYAKNKEKMKFRRLYINMEINEDSGFKHLEMPDGTRRRMTTEEKRNPSAIPENARPYRTSALESQGVGDNEPREFNGKKWSISANAHWRHKLETFERLVKENRIVENRSRLRYVHYFSDFPYTELTATWSDTFSVQNKRYVVQTNTLAIQRCILMTTDPGDLVIDPTCGSGTTASVAEHWGRRWITVDTSRISLAIARTRLMTEVYPAYILADEDEGKKILTESNSTSIKYVGSPSEEDQVRFVNKTVPRITPKSFGKGEIVPFETFYDQPEENIDGVRVSGAFTVEALLSPSRMAPRASDEKGKDSIDKLDIDSYHIFSEKMLEQLRKSGVRGRTTEQRMKFASLERREGGFFVTAEGEIESESPLQAAVAFAPEFAPIDRNFVDEAVKEIIESEKYDILYVCGFEVESDVFDYVAKKFGNLIVQEVRMNAELHMADKLKNTEERNLFSVFGAPDIIIRKREIQGGGVLICEDGQWREERGGEASEQDWDELNPGKAQIILRGLDVFDPTNPEATRSSEEKSIACWFIDTNYDDESFFVRLAYFPGYKKEVLSSLRKTLRTEISEEAVESMCKLKSQVFSIPEPKKVGNALKPPKIAVRAISHLGDEVTCTRKI